MENNQLTIPGSNLGYPLDDRSDNPFDVTDVSDVSDVILLEE
jgi:hypothetical protein